MGSSRPITLLFVICIFLQNKITNTLAQHQTAGQLQAERREYQYQRSSKVSSSSGSSVGGGGGDSGYYNSNSGNYEQNIDNTNLDEWANNNRSPIEGMAAKLKSELATHNGQQYRSTAALSSFAANANNGVICNTRCEVLPAFTGKTQEELDIIAKEMTNQILIDMKNGKLGRGQVSQPYFFENRVAQKLEELNKQHQLQYQQNVYEASNRFHQQNRDFYGAAPMVPGQNMYDSDDLQQKHQQIFDNDDLGQVQQTVFDQRQHQQQGNFYQQQSQNQHQIITRPIGQTRYHHTQTNQGEQRVHAVQPIPTYINRNVENTDRYNEERTRVYPTPVTVLGGQSTVREEQNYTATINSVAQPIPTFTTYNQFEHTEASEESDDRQYTQPIGETQIDYDRREEERVRYDVPTTPLPNFSRSYFSQKEYEERKRTEQQRPIVPGSQTYQSTSTRREEQEQTHPVVVIPTPTYTTRHETSERIDEQTRQKPAIIPTTYEQRTNNEQTYSRNQTDTMYRPTQRTTTTVQQNRDEQVVEIHTPAPVPVPSSSKHSIYDYIGGSEIRIPNYQPRRVIDDNTEFEVLNQRREQSAQIPTQSTIQQTDYEEQERRRIASHNHHQQQPTVTKYNQNKEEIEEQQQSKPFYPTRPQYTENARFNSSYSSESNYDHRVVQKPKYIFNFNDDEYRLRLQRVQQELARLGYESWTLDEYNATIASGGFTHNGYKYLYNVDAGRYEKGERIIEITEEEYEEIYRTLQDKLKVIGFNQMNAQELNQTIASGVFIRDGNKFVFNSETQEYDQFAISEKEQQQIYLRLREILKRYGYRQLSDRENEQLLIEGSLIRGGYRWVYNSVEGTILKCEYVGELTELSETEYQTIYRKLQETLKRLGYAEMTERQCNQTITTGSFERGGIYWNYNAKNSQFERVDLSQNEFRDRVELLRNELHRIGHQDVSVEEYRNIIYKGYFYHGGHRYEYNSATGRFERIELTEQEYSERLQMLKDQLLQLGFKELTAEEYRNIIYKGNFQHHGFQYEFNTNNNRFERIELSEQIYAERLQQLKTDLARLEYSGLSANELRDIIYEGSFRHRGYRYEYNIQSGQYERVELSELEYNERLTKLKDLLTRIDYQEISAQEYRAIIYRGYFNHRGYRYQYNDEYERFERIELSELEYNERLIRLREQLKRIGYGDMSDNDCRISIENGMFYFGGYEWIYSDISRNYQKGKRIQLEEDGKRNHGIIHKNRGDQPPQHFDEDYESDENLEQEPGIGYYPSDRKPEIGLMPPGSQNQMREESTPVPPAITPVAPYYRERAEQDYERQQTAQQVWPPQQTEYERRYHRTQTSYTQTTGGLPSQYVTQRAHRNTEGRPAGAELTIPYEPNAYSTEAYLVGGEGSQNFINSEQDFLRNLEKARVGQQKRDHVTAAENERQNRNKQIDSQQTQNINHQYHGIDQKSENIEDFGQKYEEIEPQRTEDLTQQLVDLNKEAANLQTSNHFARNGQGRRSDAHNVQKSENIEDFGQKYEEIDSQRTEDLTQQLVDLNKEASNLQHNQYAADRQWSSSSSYNNNQYAQKSGKLEDFGQTYEDLDGQHTEDLTQKHVQQDFSQSNNRQSNNQYNRHNDEETAQVTEITTETNGNNAENKAGFWQGLKDKTKNWLG